MNFINAQEQHRKYPDTFEAPTMTELDALHLGDFVKVCDNDERFWVKITGIDKTTITGEVNNDLVCHHEFKCGDTVTFSKECVYAIMDRN